MFTPTEMHHHDSIPVAEKMREELAALMLRRVRLAGKVGFCLYPLFAIADWLHFQDYAPLGIRAVTTLVIGLLWAVSYTSWGAQHAFGLIFTGAVGAGMGLTGIMWYKDAFLIGYADGFIQLIFTFCVLIPATTRRAALAATSILAIYFVPALVRYGSDVPPVLIIWFVAMINATIIALVGRHFANTLWEREFHARQKLHQTLDELRITQHKLLQSEKMAALGQLVASIAHDLNNALSVIVSNMHSLERAAETLTEDTEANEKSGANESTRQTIISSIGLMSRGVEREVAFIRNLLEYSAAFLGQDALNDLNTVVKTSVLMVETKARQRQISIHCKYGKLPKVRCDAKSLSQVFVIVLENACDAVPSAGNIWVRTEMIPEQAGSSHSKEEGASVIITIQDDGPGIQPEHLPRLFDPTFTTKPPGSGTGLGLALAHRIVADHGGKIAVANSSPGAIVSITLPATSALALAQAEPTH